MANVSVLGAGSWGLGLALLLNNNGHNVTVWSVLKDEVAMLQTEREHKRCLPGVKIPDSITVSGDTENVIGSADVLVLAVASPYTRSTAKMIAPFVKEGQIIVNVAKGVEEHTLLTLCQIVEEEIPCAKVAVLSGPSHAEEVSRGIPTTCVIGAHEKATAEYLQNIFMSDVFRVYTSPDMLGICIGGALKNVIALAAGIADGLGLHLCADRGRCRQVLPQYAHSAHPRGLHPRHRHLRHRGPVQRPRGQLPEGPALHRYAGYAAGGLRYLPRLHRRYPHRLSEQGLHLSGLQHPLRCSCADHHRPLRGLLLLVPVQQDPSRQVHVRHRRQRGCC